MTKRRMTPDEAQLWRQVAKTARPLPGRQLPEEKRPALSVKADQSGPLASVSRVAAPSSPKRPVTALTGVAKSDKKKIRRGRMATDGRIDLHGMTQDTARRRLTAYLQQAQTAGGRCILVITGKGAMDAHGDRTGVLRRRLPDWIKEDPLKDVVVGFEQAHVAHGGGGAFYVFLKRLRDQGSGRRR